MRIMHVLDSLDHGGAEAVVVDLANAAAAEHEVTVCCLRRLGALAGRLDPRVHVVNLGRPEGNDLTMPWRIAREARGLDAEIVHSHSWGVFLEAVLGGHLAGCRVVHTVHGPYLQHGDTRSQRVRAWLRRRLERLAARQVEAIACVSDSIAASVRDEMRLGAPIVTVHNGIPDRVAGGGRQDNLDRGAEARLISVGRLAPIKSYEVLLKAFAGALQVMPRLRLTLVGDGPERQRLEGMAEQLCIRTSVDFLGFRDDVADLLGQHDMFVLSSRHEGISIAILEAMRAGLPVVATRVGGVPETVIDGVTGRLVDPGDPERLGQVILELLDSPANLRSMGDAGRAVQHRRFSVRRATRAYLDLYGAEPAPAGSGPQRILYHHRTQGRGAEGVHIASIVRSLEKMGHEVTVVGPPGVDAMQTAGSAPVDKSAVRTRGTGSLWKALSRHAPKWLFELAEVAYNPVAASRLRRAWRAGEYDLIYERYAFYMVAGARFAARRGVPFVLEANEVNGLEERARAQVMPRLCGRFERHLFSRCDGIMTVSSYLRDRIVETGVHPQRVRVAPNAVHPSDCLPVARSTELTDRYGLNGRVVVGFAGWFDHWDRLDLLLDATAALRQRFPDLLAMFVGDGPIAPELHARARDLGVDGNVLFIGAVPRATMAAHLALFDIAVLPHSNQFGSPVVLFEFFARGLPVVAPRLAPITDVVRDDVNGLLFEPLSGDEMAAALARLLESPETRARIGRGGREIALQRHTWDHNAEAILDVVGYQGEIEAPEEHVVLAS